MNADPWEHLRSFTAARIALGRAGGSVPTRPLLNFRMSHAEARDAVHAPFDPDALAEQARHVHPEVVVFESRAANRTEYLQRPDYGRRLSETSREKMSTHAISPAPDLVIILSDGLSSRAVNDHGIALLSALLPLFFADGWSLAPIMVVNHARVAIQDEIGGILAARLSLIVLGERPGLGAPDSLGAYFTFAPVPGRSDAERNCVSNIRPEGLVIAAAARKLHALMSTSRRLGLSGVRLKDNTPIEITDSFPPDALDV